MIVSTTILSSPFTKGTALREEEMDNAAKSRTSEQPKVTPLFIPDVIFDAKGTAIIRPQVLPDSIFEPTNALTTNPSVPIESARYINVNGTKQARRRQLTAMSDEELKNLRLKRQVLALELKYAEIEENIITCRHMLLVNEEKPKDIAQAKLYLNVAIPVYQKHMERMTDLKHVNAKINEGPQLPITFTEEETSELYWWLIKYGSIDLVEGFATADFTDRAAQLSERLQALADDSDEWRSITQDIRLLKAAADRWRPAADRAIHERCDTLRGFVADEIMAKEAAAARTDASNAVRAKAGGTIDPEIIDGTEWE